MPTTTVVLHQYDLSPFCEKVRRILNHKNIAFQVREIAPSTAPLTIPRFNKIGKLPALRLGDRTIADSTEIAYAVEELHPEPALLPEDPVDRARCHVLEDWADESLYFYEMTMRFTWPHNAKRWVPEAVAHDGRWFKPLAPRAVPWMLGRRLAGQGLGQKPRELVLREVQRHFDALAALLDDRQWLVGDTITLADVAVASQVTAIRGADEGAAAIDARPAVAAWLRRTDELAPGKRTSPTPATS